MTHGNHSKPTGAGKSSFGLIDTDMNRAPDDPDRLARLGPSVPMGRAGEADEVAEAVLWLLSDASSYVTGSVVTVAGGRC